MTTRFLTDQELEKLKADQANHPTEVRSLLAMYDSLCIDWYRALTVVERHRLKFEMSRVEVPDWLKS